jgi:hypothetical protein
MIHLTVIASFFVAPAKAGVQGQATKRCPWIPAFAGKTKEKQGGATTGFCVSLA